MDNIYRLPIFETMVASWHKVKGSKVTILGAHCWIFSVACISGFLSGYFHIFIDPLSEVISLLIIIILAMGIVRLGIRRANEQDIAAIMVFYPISHFSLILKLIGCCFLYVLMLLPSMILIFVAAASNTNIYATMLGIVVNILVLAMTFFFLVRARLCLAYILDKELGPWQAIKESFRVTECNFWRLIAIYILNLLIVEISSIPFGIGLIWSLPYFYISYGQIYRQLSEKNTKINVD